MIKDTTMLYLYVETSLHAGVGSGLSSIDLPIQRERTTQYPMIQGSGIKGKLRAAIEGDREKLSAEQKYKVDILFGPPTSETKDSNNEHAGALIVGDARMLLFPVRSLDGVFAYATSYDVLNRFKRDLERNHPDKKLPWNISSTVSQNIALVTNPSEVQANNRVVLEEFSFTAEADQQVNGIAQWLADNTLPSPDQDDYWHKKLRSSLVILSDNDFRDFALYATEIITRVHIDRGRKTVKRGALWTEEHLPTDTLLYVPLYATDSRKQVDKDDKNNNRKILASEVLSMAKEEIKNKEIIYLQLGGDETVGRGMVRMHWENGATK